MKDEFLGKINSSWAELMEIAGKDGEAQMVTAPDNSGWSIKDMLAHITWYEQEMVGILQIHIFGGSDLWKLTLQERNDAIYALYKNQPLKEVLSELHAVHQRLVSLLEGIREEDLVDPSHFPGMPVDWKPCEVIASNTYDHYAEHMEQIKDLRN